MSLSAVLSANAPREPSNENSARSAEMPNTRSSTGSTASASGRPLSATGAASRDSFLRTFATNRSHQYATRYAAVNETNAHGTTGRSPYGRSSSDGASGVAMARMDTKLSMTW